MPLDHLVINAQRDMDPAAKLFERLGFCLTPRGHHSAGSINHLMLERNAYLEIVAVPPTGRQRQDVLDSSLGLDGLVFRTDDAVATHARLVAAGFAPQEPSLLDRPVEVDGETRSARFHNVRMTAAEFPAGRVYFCNHLTPELVWRDEWLEHPNGFRGIGGMAIEHPDPAGEAARFSRLIERPAERDGGEWRIEDQGVVLAFRQGDAPRFASAELLFGDLDGIGRRAEDAPGVEWEPNGADAGMLRIPSLVLSLVCRAARG